MFVKSRSAQKYELEELHTFCQLQCSVQKKISVLNYKYLLFLNIIRGRVLCLCFCWWKIIKIANYNDTFFLHGFAPHTVPNTLCTFLHHIKNLADHVVKVQRMHSICQSICFYLNFLVLCNILLENKNEIKTKRVTQYLK